MKRAKKHQIFATWWTSIPRRDVREKTSLLICNCAISRSILYNWTSNRTEIPDMAMPTIELVAGAPIFSPKQSFLVDTLKHKLL